jgi:hypothetical protein
VLANFTPVQILFSIQRANIQLPHESTLNERQTDYTLPKAFKAQIRVSLVATPNDAQLEALMNYDFVRQKFSLIGEIDRNNKYGNTSICVQNRHLRKLCYCI